MNWVKRSAALAAAGGIVMALAGTASAQAVNPFPSLIGAWSGKGTARIEGGKNEKLSCKGYYSGTGGSEMKLNIICANNSTKVDLRSQLKYANGRVTGTWEERTFNQTGTISGSADESKLRLNIGGGALNGLLSVSFSGSKQSVSLSTQGSALKGVNISFARNG
ncbi:hypothetical protein [Hyphomicrobium sp. D-2]|uniref:hypothetical protein n=1 Tax=Hyphomicrobium sp. D-2 TaxID=3041621 RepID=UPI002458D776|nr:hypothetical protein [Hyphomicrobium sp. D-2]MDH4980929.1 hypothetical protein [Hyphomicrobium sp. D-2]